MKSLVIIVLITTIVIDADVVQKVRVVRQSEAEEHPSTVSVIASEPPSSPTDPCTPKQCNHRGTCFGQAWYAGRACEDRYCDSARDCNGRGWCMGTASSYTCLCNLGFSGTRCELQTVSSSVVISTPPPFGTVSSRIVEDVERIEEPADEQI